MKSDSPNLPPIETLSWSGLGAENFLKNYWQEKPVVISKFVDSVNLIEADELAGLACEPDVESRIIRQVLGQWQVSHGPFDESIFPSLPTRDWTLLVQAVDQWVPEVRALLENFHFLPAWRLDDIMVSFAPPGGTVAPHFDFFDVFLVQGEGSRRWQLGGICDSQSAMVPDTPVKLLENFIAESEVILEPGDVLYVPAKLSHYGVSIEDSLTYSIGFRAPSIRELVDGVATAALETLSEDQRYRDSADSLTAASGEISEKSIDILSEMMAEAMSDRELLRDWLGKTVTEKKYPDLEDDGFDPQDIDLAPGGVFWKKTVSLVRNPGSRFAYKKINSEIGGESPVLSVMYVDGESYETSLGFAELFCNQQNYSKEQLLSVLADDIPNVEVLSILLSQGSILTVDF